jgi:glycosyltransferase involved in cell wall biosynthesis
MTSQKILFISHDASRTGAPIFLLNFLRWLKENSDISFEILLKNGGELQREFEAIAPVLLFHQETPVKRGLLTKIRDRIGFQAKAKAAYYKLLKEKLIRDNIGLIYANTVANGEVLAFLSSLGCPTICHVHELEHWICHRTGLKKFELVKRYTQNYIAVSEAVKRNLVENHNIPAEKIYLNYPFIPIHSDSISPHQQTRELILETLGIPQEAKLVCGSGTTDWRKAPDLFIQLARAVSKKYCENPVYFLWIGGKKEGANFDELWYDVKKLGLEEYIRFLGIQLNPLDYFAASDIFALVSREDPYPLVCLEAASLGKPIVCFDDAGGEKEFVEDDCGFVVPYLDIETMATKVVSLLNCPELCQELGQRAQQKVEQRHNIQVVAHQLLTVIEKFL